jgi:CubicO group peptidase (beta-lactamase class C family)
MSHLPPLPPQPAATPWPTDVWPEAEPGAGVDRARLERAFDAVLREPAPDATGETHALLVVHRGAIVAEGYDSGNGVDSTLVSWSMAKSITHAWVGLLRRDGKLDVAAPAPVPEWQGEGDPRGVVTLEQLLRMVDGLDFLEDYVEGDVSNVIDMLFGRGKDDVAGYAARQPLAHAPGTCWSYSSGTSNIVARIAGAAVGGGAEGALGYLQRELFGPLGMTTAKPRFDAAGTFIGSSFVFATARDFARFGLLYLRDGMWKGERVLPEGWVDHARTPTPASRGEYGAHWWLALDGSGRFSANGYRGQYILCDPARDLVIVRLGGSTPEQRGHVVRNLLEIVESFPLLSPPTP